MGNAKQFVPRPSWKRANDNNIINYKAELESILNDIKVHYDDIHCNNLHCSSHGNDIDTYCNMLIDACMKATDRCIPRTRKRGRVGCVAVEVLGVSTRVGHRICTRAYLHVRHTRSLRGR